MHEFLDRVDRALEAELLRSFDTPYGQVKNSTSLAEEISSVVDSLNKRLFLSLSLRIVQTENKGSVSHGAYFVPRNLNDYIEASLAQEIAASLTLRYCAHCQTPYQVGKMQGAMRTDRKTCSDSCRTMLNRKAKL